jgi:hypothetical protein
MKIAALLVPLLVVALVVYLFTSCSGQWYERSPNTVEDAQLFQRYEALCYLVDLDNVVYGSPALAAALGEVQRMVLWQRVDLYFEQANRRQELLR